MRSVITILIAAVVAVAWLSFGNLSSIQETGRALDIMIEGEGFLQVFDDATGEIFYTRNGHLELDANNNLGIRSSTKAYLIEPAINIPKDASKVTIDSQGQVWVEQPGKSELCSVGCIEMSKFENPEALVEVDEGIFRDPPLPIAAMPGEAGLGLLVSGKLEIVR